MIYEDERYIDTIELAQADRQRGTFPDRQWSLGLKASE